MCFGLRGLMGANGRQAPAGAPPRGGILTPLNGLARMAALGMRQSAPVRVNPQEKGNRGEYCVRSEGALLFCFLASEV